MLVAVLLAALAAGPDYDAFSDSSGRIADERQLEAAQAMVRDPDQLEAVHADALRGNARAARVFLELETRYFPDIGRAVAEREARPECLVPVYRELSGRCIPDWSFLDFLRRDAPGGARLRKAIADAYAARARQLAIQNRAIVASVNALLAVAVVKAAVRSPVTSAASSLAEQRIAAGSNSEMLGQAIRRIQASDGTAAQRADLFERLAAQIKQLSGGSWSAIRGTGLDGSYVFLGEAGEVLVISPEGALFRGSISTGGVRVEGAGRFKVDYPQLRRIP